MKALTDRYIVEDDITTIKGEEYVKEQDKGELYFGGNKQIVVETVGFEKILRQQRYIFTQQISFCTYIYIYE